jgi:hypothetical protein
MRYFTTAHFVFEQSRRDSRRNPAAETMMIGGYGASFSPMGELLA